MGEELREFLDTRRGEFAGNDWRPTHLLPPSVVQYIYIQALMLYREVLGLPLHTLTQGAVLVKRRQRMRWSLEDAKKARSVDHAAFVSAVADVFRQGKAVVHGVKLADRLGDLER